MLESIFSKGLSSRLPGAALLDGAECLLVLQSLVAGVVKLSMMQWERSVAKPAEKIDLHNLTYGGVAKPATTRDTVGFLGSSLPVVGL